MEALQAELETSKAEVDALREELARHQSGWQTLREYPLTCVTWNIPNGHQPPKMLRAVVTGTVGVLVADGPSTWLVLDRHFGRQTLGMMQQPDAIPENRVTHMLRPCGDQDLASFWVHWCWVGRSDAQARSMISFFYILRYQR